MTKGKFTEGLIDFTLRQAETGIRLYEVCRHMSISEETFLNWKKRRVPIGLSIICTFIPVF